MVLQVGDSSCLAPAAAEMTAKEQQVLNRERIGEGTAEEPVQSCLQSAREKCPLYVYFLTARQHANSYRSIKSYARKPAPTRGY